MKTEYQIRVANSMLKEIEAIEDSSAYLNNAVKRGNLALLYKSVINIGAAFPLRPKSMNSNVTANLYKRVSETCSACVKRAVMKNVVDSAIRDIVNYSKELTKFVADFPNVTEVASVHDLRPTENDNKIRG